MSFVLGSMTGAPKLRTVHLLEELEDYYPRGVYSGILGFVSVTGAADFSVVIRTAVFRADGDKTHVSVGAGGAIVALSDATDEYDEMLLKSRAVISHALA